MIKRGRILQKKDTEWQNKQQMREWKTFLWALAIAFYCKRWIMIYIYIYIYKHTHTNTVTWPPSCSLHKLLFAEFLILRVSSYCFSNFFPFCDGDKLCSCETEIKISHNIFIYFKLYKRYWRFVNNNNNSSNLSGGFLGIYIPLFDIFLHRKLNEVLKHDHTQTAVAHDRPDQSSWNKYEHVAKVTTNTPIYINEVLRCQFVYRKISTLTFETDHVYIF